MIVQVDKYIRIFDSGKQVTFPDCYFGGNVASVLVDSFFASFPLFFSLQYNYCFDWLKLMQHTHGSGLPYRSSF